MCYLSIEVELAYSIAADYAAVRCDAAAYSLSDQRSEDNKRRRMHFEDEIRKKRVLIVL